MEKALFTPLMLLMVLCSAGKAATKCGPLYVQIEDRINGVHLEEGVSLPDEVIRDIILSLDAHWQRVEITGHLRFLSPKGGYDSPPAWSETAQIFLNSFADSLPPEEATLAEIEDTYRVTINLQTGVVSRRE